MKNTGFNFTNFYAETDQDGAYPIFDAAVYEFFLGSAQALKKPGMRILDIGCGVGHVALRAKNAGGGEHHIIGIDPAEGEIRKAYEADTIHEAIVGTICDAPFPDNSFDVCLCWAVLCLVDDWRKALREMSRIVKPGGEIVILDMHSRNPWVKFYSGRPSWLEKLLHGHVKPRVWPVDERRVKEMSPGTIHWQPPEFRIMFGRHKSQKIRYVHNIVRSLLRLFNCLTGRPWTYNYILLNGEVRK